MRKIYKTPSKNDVYLENIFLSPTDREDDMFVYRTYYNNRFYIRMRGEYWSVSIKELLDENITKTFIEAAKYFGKFYFLKNPINKLYYESI